MAFNYKNIAISGGVAVGKNTLFENLKQYLEPLGWKFRTTGQILRDYTNENVMPNASLVDDNFHRKIEDKARELLEKDKNWVIEAWLGGFIARDLKDVLKVLLICSHDSIRIDRVANRDKITVVQAKEAIKKRENDNFKTWRNVYGDYNFLDPSYFDVIIDTFSSGQLETTGKVLDALGFNHDEIVIEKK